MHAWGEKSQEDRGGRGKGAHHGEGPRTETSTLRVRWRGPPRGREAGARRGWGRGGGAGARRKCRKRGEKQQARWTHASEARHPHTAGEWEMGGGEDLIDRHLPAQVMPGALGTLAITSKVPDPNKSNVDRAALDLTCVPPPPPTHPTHTTSPRQPHPATVSRCDTATGAAVTGLQQELQRRGRSPARTIFLQPDPGQPESAL